MTSSPAKPRAWKQDSIFLWWAAVPAMGTCCTSWQWILAGEHLCWKHPSLERNTSWEVRLRVTSLYLSPLPAVQGLGAIKGYLIFQEGLPISCSLSCWRNLQCLAKVYPWSSQMYNLVPRVYLHSDAFPWELEYKKGIPRIMHIIFSLFYIFLTPEI